MFPLFQAHYKRVYMPGSLWSSLFFLICLLAIGGLPFVIGWFMDNFWLEDNYFYQKPNVNFTGRGVLRVSTTLGSEYLWTTSSDFNDQFLTGTPLELFPFFSLMADQQEEDGKNDLLSFTVSFPSNLTSPYGGVDSIEKVVFMPELKYHVKHYLATIELYAAPLFTFTRTAEEIAGSPVCAVTRADLNFYATGRIIGRGVYKATTSALTLLKEPSPLMNLEYFSRFYTNQSHTALLRVYEEAAGGFSLMKDKYGFPDLGLVNSFTWNMQMRIQNAVIYYKPTDAEALKWVLIQYFVIGFLIQWAVWKIREVFVTRGIIATNAKDGVNEINA